MGHTWTVTTGGMAGSNTGLAANVSVDANGYLHLKITQSGGKWYCAELFTNDTMGFGTYQWQIEGSVDRMDKNVVLGLFPYGPVAGIGGDGTNEIDIEYARWGKSSWPDGNYTVYPNSGSTVGDTTFEFSLNGGSAVTATFVWSAASVTEMTQSGFHDIGDSSGMICKWRYAPSNPAVNIPQRAMPLGMNLWLCGGCGGAPSNGQPLDIIVRKFTHVRPGTSGAGADMRGSSNRGRNFLVNPKNGTLRLAAPVQHGTAAEFFNLTGKRVHAVQVPAGAGEISVIGLPAGVYFVRFGQPTRPAGTGLIVNK
jgi:hypothetical protein